MSEKLLSSVLAHGKGKEQKMKRERKILRARSMQDKELLSLFLDNFSGVIDLGDAVSVLNTSGQYALDVRYADLVKNGFLDRFIRGLHIFGDTSLKISECVGHEIAINVDRITEWHSQYGYTLITVGGFREVPVCESDAEVSDRIFEKLDELGCAQ